MPAVTTLTLCLAPQASPFLLDRCFLFGAAAPLLKNDLRLTRFGYSDRDAASSTGRFVFTSFRSNHMPWIICCRRFHSVKTRLLKWSDLLASMAKSSPVTARWLGQVDYCRSRSSPSSRLRPGRACTDSSQSRLHSRQSVLDPLTVRCRNKELVWVGWTDTSRQFHPWSSRHQAEPREIQQSDGKSPLRRRVTLSRP
jgi:hypothetical protein